MPFRISLPLAATSLMFVHTVLTGNKFTKEEAYLKQVSFDVPLKYTYYFNKVFVQLEAQSIITSSKCTELTPRFMLLSGDGYFEVYNLLC
jgi:hypothetical protein